MIILDLPWPPSVNHYLGTSKTGRRYVRPRGVAFKSRVCELVAEQQVKALTGRVSVFIAAHPPDRRKRDIDNLNKMALDALMHAGVMLDDEQVDSLHIVRREVIKGGKLSVVVTEIK
jgi:crossover junction endodeoxyribonuclease RusA